jgi:NADPH:quinone reductase-like Zn-dependent oxidoreductase
MAARCICIALFFLGSEAFLVLPSISIKGGHNAARSSLSFKSAKTSAKSTSTPLLKTSALKMTLQTPQLVAVVGATGGVGRLAVAACMQLGVKIKAVVRDEKKAASLLPTVL